MSQTQPVSPKKKHYVEQMKDDLAAKDAEIARLQAALAEQADAHLSNTDPLKAVIDDVSAQAAEIAKRKEKPNQGVDAAPVDDLAWITKDMRAVYVVAKNMTLTLRPTNTNYNPIMSGILIHSDGDGSWSAMPFDIRSNHPDPDTRASEDKYNAACYGNWGHFCVSRQLAQSVFGDSRYPIPTEAVVSAKDFRGFDYQVQSAIGKHVPITDPDPLREVVRRLLQSSEVFVDVSRHLDRLPVGPPKPGDLNVTFPNPYRRRLGSLAPKLPAVKHEGMTR